MAMNRAKKGAWNWLLEFLLRFEIGAGSVAWMSRGIPIGATIRNVPKAEAGERQLSGNVVT